MKKTTLRRLLWVAATLAVLYSVMRLYFYATDDFRISNISQEMPYQQNWDFPTPTADEEQRLKHILNQEFSYLGKGAQSYAFASDDGKYVIKFFKFKHLRPSLFQDMLPSIGFIKQYKDKQAARKQRKLYGVFQGYKLAYDLNKKESGLIFIQLNTSTNPDRVVIVRDKMGFRRSIHLRDIPFVVQDKGQTLRVVLNALLKQGDVQTAKDRIGDIFDLYASEYRKGIYDHDHGVMYNTGFIGNQPIHLDVGKMVKEDSMRQTEVAKKDMNLVASKIIDWLQRSFPQYSEELISYINERLEEYHS